MAEKLAPGTWELEKSDNFDEYMKAVGVGMAKRLIGNRAKPKQEISIDSGKWTITTSTTVSKVVLTFQPGVEFDETTADGRKVKTICRIDGNKLVQSQKGSVNSTITRDFTKDSFLMTLEAAGVVCTRHYKKSS